MLTFISLLLHLELFRQILILLPPDIRPDRLIIDKVAVVIELGLIEIRLREDFILKEVVWREHELQLEAEVLGLVVGCRVRNANVS